MPRQGWVTFVIIEIKTSVADFRADRKWVTYRDFADRLYFAVPDHFPRALIPEECGLMVADPFGAALLRMVAQPRSAPAAAAPSPCALRVSRQRGCDAISTRRPTISTGYEEICARLPGEPRDRRGGAVAWYHLGEKHLATDAPDEFGSDDLVDSVVGALDEKLRPDCLDEIDRRVLLEYDNQIDCRQRSQHLGPRRLGLDGTARTFSRAVDASLLRPTTNRSQAALACPSSATCPGCSKSKQPFVKPILSPWRAPPLDEIERICARATPCLSYRDRAR